MAKTGLIERFDESLFEEKIFTQEVGRTRAAKNRTRVRGDILQAVQEARRSGHLETILTLERHFLENDKAEYVSSPAMKSSLDAALSELKAAERLSALVQRPGEYRAIDEAHSLPKNRRGGVPFDEARQFFTSHAARLLNQDKSRLDTQEKQIIEARKQNMRAGAKLYEARQRQALGLEPAPDKKRDRGTGMEM
jgi:hypothetical protein